MSGRRPRGVTPNRILDASTGSGTVTLTKPATALIFLFGGCGSGAAQNAGSRAGGGGGAALYRRVTLSAGSVIAYSVGAGGLGVSTDPGAVGNNGGDTTLTLPDGRILRAGGGQGGQNAVGGVGGVATGGEVNRTGGSGGNTGIAGTAGEDGGSPGRPAPSGNEGGGGGAAGLESIIQAGGFPYGTGSDAETVSPGSSVAGSNGRVLVIFVATA